MNEWVSEWVRTNQIKRLLCTLWLLCTRVNSIEHCSSQTLDSFEWMNVSTYVLGDECEMHDCLVALPLPLLLPVFSRNWIKARHKISADKSNSNFFHLSACFLTSGLWVFLFCALHQLQANRWFQVVVVVVVWVLKHYYSFVWQHVQVCALERESTAKSIWGWCDDGD